jgi:NAD(P)-dependent dehydrogenase (short-subunit alcohol dehydrogenase family)
MLSEYSSSRKKPRRTRHFHRNAGLAGGGVEEEEDESWRYIVETNLLGYIGCAKEPIHQMWPLRKGHIFPDRLDER